MSKPSIDVLRLPIEKRAEIALKVAVAKAIDEHTRLGLPVYIWRNNRVVELSPRKTHSSSPLVSLLPLALARRRSFGLGRCLEPTYAMRWPAPLPAGSLETSAELISP